MDTAPGARQFQDLLSGQIMALRFAVASEDFGTNLKRAIAAAAQAEVSGLRLNARTEVRPDDFSDTALRQLALFVREQRMSVAGLMFSTRYALQDSQHLQQRIDGIRKAMPLARQLGTLELIIRCGQIPDPDADLPIPSASQPSNSNVDSLSNPFSFAPENTATTGTSGSQQFLLLAEVLNDLVRHGNHVGCTLQLQLSSFHPERVRRLIAEVTAGPVGVVFDAATCVMSGSDPVSTFREIYQHVGYVRIRDAVKDVDGAGVEVPVGEGTVDWTEVLPTIAEADYRGWICIERMGGDNRAGDTLSGVARLRKLVPGAES
jgi:sugar phosphate isomerase/epimerase